MKAWAIGLSMLLAAAAAGAQSMPSDDEAIVFADPGDVEFVPLPGLPPGSEFAVVNGDPKDGPFDMYVRLQPGVDIPLHFHSASERAVVVQGPFPMRYEDGTVHVGMVGDYMYLQARTPHAVSCPEEGEACVALFSFDGPFDINWVEPAPKVVNPEPTAP